MKRREFVQKIVVSSVGVTSIGYSVDSKFGSGQYCQKDDSNTPSEIRIIAPSTILVNESFSITVRILTTPYFTKWAPDWNRTGATVNGPFNKSARGIHFMDNVLPEWDGIIQVSGSAGLSGIANYSFSEGEGPYQKDKRPARRLDGFQFSNSGIKYIKIVDPASGIAGISNAIEVREQENQDRLFWGDTHCHSIFGDGVRSPEELHAFARDEACLDVFAHTEHTEAITDDQWDYFTAVSNRFYEPGKYVSLIGGEWTSKPYGHRNFIYRGSSGPVIRSSDENQNTLEKLFSIVEKNQGLVIANHPMDSAFPIDFDTYYHDPKVERLVEMYSIGGSQEISTTESGTNGKQQNNSVQDGLKNGRKLGMLGVGDTHDGRPGDALHEWQVEPDSYKGLQKPGLTGIWAKDLSRESIFEALWNRRVYATTHHRTIIKFSINDFPMGSIIKASNQLEVKTEIASELLIEKVELLKEEIVLEEIHPIKKNVEWIRDISQSGSEETWYYLRVSLENNNFAWVSPIWVSNN